MNWTRRTTGFALLAALGLVFGSTPNANPQATTAAPAAGQDASKTPYTMAEYNSYQACAAEKNPTLQIKCLDDFVAKYPASTLLVYVYPLYYQAYGALKNYPKVIEYADKMLALGNDKTDVASRYQAYLQRAFAFTNLPPAQQPDPTKARQAALEGLKALGDIKKPDTMSDADWAKETRQPKIVFNYACGIAATSLKDYQGSVDCYKAVVALNPDDAIASYRVGQSYLSMTPPQSVDAFWYFGKAITSKGATEAQSKQVKGYLRKLVANYQGGTVCDSLTDAEMNELLQLAGSAADRPATYNIPSSTDLDAARKDMTIASVFNDLKTGGDKAKITWLASCGLEFPDVPGKLLEVTKGATESDPIVLKIAFVTSDAEFQSATAPNMEVKVAGQPDAARLEKDNPVRFTGTLTAYDPDPAFMLHWEKAKVNAEDIPKEKEKPKRPVRRPASKNPGN